MTRPNLFQYATSELSQDAMLCWLLAWSPSMYAQVEPELHALATKFIDLAFSKHGLPLPGVISTIEVRRQVSNVDILATINGTFELLIEDKAGTQEHSDQLVRYLANWQQQKRPGQCVVPVYVQTGEQSNFQNVLNAGFQPITRTELLSLMDEVISDANGNAILADFYAYLKDLEHQFQAFQTIPLNQSWPERAWRGFFSALQQHLGQGDWGHVPTASKGFAGFWWNWLGPVGAAEPYLQLEYGRLCFKLSAFTASDTRKIELARTWQRKLTKVSEKGEISITKPRRYKEGKTMTAAISAVDYRVADTTGLIDMVATVAVLKQAEVLLRQAARIMNEQPKAAF
ncbi:PD-(D/E)XK nuclease family protein [Microvirga sp. STS02]|uniref:PD-(D/E)XK nuclease family protein n=1 Tax=Hymenobacter negativus TaxID=2795026 RepID=UPI0018DD75CA|nr:MULTISPECIES: PD-(D/E)XK nuclease family protein [Bacteria]MBH8571329.1 PD-(D/E)XK nuclease family protein [Hymenobacter negativus]MBR7211067.1 PD-(D/E)XK nuclease family protein [Microvirga sp. STS02]